MQRRKKWGRPSKHNCHQFCLALSYKNSVFNIHEMKVQESLFKQSHFLRDLTGDAPEVTQQSVETSVSMTFQLGESRIQKGQN